MSTRHVRAQIQCPKCQAPITVWSRPVIGPAREPELYRAFLEDRLNPKGCSSCGVSIAFDSPTVVLTPHWTGVVLENPAPITAGRAFAITEALTEGLGVQDASPVKPILVVGRAEELRRIIANRPEDRFCAVPMTYLDLLNYASFIPMLAALVDAYVAEDRPEQAYWMFPEIINAFHDLYFHPEFLNLVERTVRAAGNRIAKGLMEPRTAEQDWQQIKSQLARYAPHVPEWCAATYLCFYENNSPPWRKQVPAIWNTAVDLMQLTGDGNFDMRNAHRHYAVFPVQAVVQEELSPVQQVRKCMLYLTTAASSTEWQALRSIPRDVQLDIRDSSVMLNQKWGKLSPSERAEAGEIYKKLTGLDFCREFKLDPFAGDAGHSEFLDLLERQFLHLSSDEIEARRQSGALSDQHAAAIRFGKNLWFVMFIYVLDCLGALSPKEVGAGQQEVQRMFGPDAELRTTIPMLVDENDVFLEGMIQQTYTRLRSTAQPNSAELEPNAFASRVVNSRLRPRIIEMVRTSLQPR